MIKNPELFQKFERELMKKEKLDMEKKLSIISALHKEAIYLGVIPLKNPLEGLEIDIKIAKVVNSVSKTSEKNSL